ncbi:hypothetical protein VNI00_012072 [Paramarasmius palmivorus]|uniref:XPG-I domain-containing protein n=1 Tax=Paramarasmius palmivorus TaxID=297713 RepID=A0AAW0CBW3_9AGAR
MGVSGFWPMVKDARKTVLFQKFCEEQCIAKGWPLIIGINASILAYHCPAASNGSHYDSQCGLNIDIKSLILKFAFLSHLPASFVLFLDGPNWEEFKRGRKVGMKPHWMTPELIQLAEAFCFFVHECPGDAEVKLVDVAARNVIDAVMTDDSDAVICGALLVICFPEDYKNPDVVSVYHLNDIVQHPAKPITRYGMLLYTALIGHDELKEKKKKDQN